MVAIAIPTLSAGPKLAKCLASLEKQTLTDFEVYVVDNSGWKVARETAAQWRGVAVIENKANAGFGAAVNQVCRGSRSRYLATLNDDAVADPGWLEALVGELEAHPEAGMCASQVRLSGGSPLDSAGMLISGDASSKQRGHGEPPQKYEKTEEVLLPSGCAALYRREMLDQIGLFDESFFLYCEDTDLGLRARWAGWRCRYAPAALVEHDYSRTAGAASPLKAYYVERNRIFVLLKNFPLKLLLRAPAATLARYFWHSVAAVRGEGSAGRYRENGGMLEMAYLTARAHASLLKYGWRLAGERRRIRRTARISSRDFAQLVERYFISPREVGSL